MQFLKTLRPLVHEGRVTTSIRIWTHPHVKVGNAYPMEEGFVIVDALKKIELQDVTPKHARDSGFESLDGLLKTARHGSGRNIYFVKFHYSESETDVEAREPISSVIRKSRRKDS